MSEANRILVGVVGAPHGVRGELRLKSFTAQPMSIADYRALWTRDGRRCLTVISARLLRDDMLVVRFEGVADRDAAQTLTNTQLYIARADLPVAAEDEFYHADLIGLRADTAAGVTAGTIVALQNFGAGDLLEIKSEVNDTFYVPFTRAFVPVVNIGDRRVVLADAALPGEETDPDDDPSTEP